MLLYTAGVILVAVMLLPQVYQAVQHDLAAHQRLRRTAINPALDWTDFESPCRVSVAAAPAQAGGECQGELDCFLASLDKFHQGDWADALSGLNGLGLVDTIYLSGWSAWCNAEPQQARLIWAEQGKRIGDLFLELGQERAEQGDGEDARQWLSLAAGVDPDLAEAGLALARLDEQQGHLEEALARYQEHLVAHPQDAAAHYSAAYLAYQLDRLALAEQHATLAIQFDPATWYFYQLSGNIAARLEDWPAAQLAYETALVYQPDACWSRLGLVSLFLDQGQLSAAAGELDQALAGTGCDDPAPLAYYSHQLGALSSRSGDLAQAAVYLEKSLAIDPRDAGVYTDLLSVYLSQGQCELYQAVKGRYTAQFGAPPPLPENTGECPE
ncbi:MAG: tetratricopeptide repeat protein [Chloroflexi bacterium]|nr:tetratricopeptide repeat protein [Chloroflexota bacterium]